MDMNTNAHDDDDDGDDNDDERMTCTMNVLLEYGIYFLMNGEGDVEKKERERERWNFRWFIRKSKYKIRCRRPFRSRTGTGMITI